MKKIVMVLLAVVVLVTLPTAVVAAQGTTHEINFDIDGVYNTYTKYADWDPDTSVTTNATFGGQIKEKNGKWYLSTMTGNITIDGVPHQIVVTQLNQAGRVHYFLHYDHLSRWSWECYCQVELNIEGDKYTGNLWFWVMFDIDDGEYTQTGAQSQMYFEGIPDGEIVRFFCVPNVQPPPEIEWR